MGKRKRKGLEAADPLDGARQAAATIRDHGEATAATFAALAEEAAQTQQRIKTEVEKMTAAEGQKCAGRLDRLCDEVGAAFQAQQEEVEQLHKKVKRSHFEDPIKLNVGGQQFSTSLDTLRSVPDTYFSACFSGNYSMKKGEDGTYFIDRDPEVFGTILNYLRTRKVILPTSDEEFIAKLLCEADFYMLAELESMLRPKPIPKPTYDSEIATAEDFAWLKDQIPDGLPQSFNLLYRSTRDGDTPAKFHELCDGKE